MQLSYNKKTVNAWAMYDWANSVYNLVITTTFFPAYYAAVTSKTNAKFANGVPFLGRTYVNTEIKDYVLAVGFLIIAALSPILSSIADSRGNKKKFMLFFCLLGSVSCSLLYFFNENTVSFALVCFMLAGIGFYGSQVFYNSYLPEIAPPEKRDAVSAKGYTMGYIGSVIMQLIAFALVIAMPNSSTPLQLTFLLVGIWWLGFAQITFKGLPKNKIISTAASTTNIVSSGFVELKKVWQIIKVNAVFKSFLSAFFFYSMGVQTVMLVAIDFGIKELKLPNEMLIITAVIIQLVAIAGAIGMSKLSTKIGNIKVLMFTVLLWITVCVMAYFITTPTHFYVLAGMVGLVMGGIQSMSRSTYSKMIPLNTHDTASFFSFYDVTEKLAIVIGLFSFGIIEGLTHNMRNSILVLILFFIIGFLFLYFTYWLSKKQTEIFSSTID